VRPFFEGGDEMNVRKGSKENAAADGEDLTADANGFREIASNVRERGEEKISEIVADEARGRRENDIGRGGRERASSF